MTYTDAEIIAAARAAVEEYGADYVYDPGDGGECHYANEDGTPSCLVGHIVARLDLELFDKIAANHVLNYETSAADLAGVGFDISEGQESALYRAQALQDGGGYWGVALSTLETNLS